MMDLVMLLDSDTQLKMVVIHGTYVYIEHCTLCACCIM